MNPGPSGSSATAARRGDLVVRAYEELRELILTGHFLPGERLSQQRLSAELTIGRTPLREALRLLEGDGFVVSTANRGVTVVRPKLGHTEQLYAMRFLLEPPMHAALVDELSTAEDLTRMERHLDEMRASAHHRHDFQHAHLAFHLVALERYGEELESLVLDMYRRVEWHQRTYMSRPQAPQDFVALDRALLDALREHRAEDVRAVLQAHLLDVAIGIIVDVEPDHRFGPLLAAARGSGVDVEVEDDRIVSRPVRIVRSDASQVAVETTHVRYTPSAPTSSSHRVPSSSGAVHR